MINRNTVSVWSWLSDNNHMHFHIHQSLRSHQNQDKRQDNHLQSHQDHHMGYQGRNQILQTLGAFGMKQQIVLLSVVSFGCRERFQEQMGSSGHIRWHEWGAVIKWMSPPVFVMMNSCRYLRNGEIDQTGVNHMKNKNETKNRVPRNRTHCLFSGENCESNTKRYEWEKRETRSVSLVFQSKHCTCHKVIRRSSTG